MFSEQSWNASRSVETTHVWIAGLVGAGRERRDHVVRLPALELEVAVAERLDDRPEVRELLAQQVRHRPPPLLVRLGDLGAVRRPRVPRDRDPSRPVVGEQLEEHVREAEQGVRRLAVGRLQLLGQREVRAVGEVVAVDEEELRVARRAVVELRAPRRSASSATSRIDAIVRTRDRAPSRSVPFADEHLDGAGRAARRAAPRAAAVEPRLPGASRSPGSPRARSSGSGAEDGASGAVALRGRRTSTGYVLGAPARRDLGPERLGRARPATRSSEPELVRDLYAAAAERWVARAAPRTTRSSPRPTRPSSTPGSGSASGTSTSTAIRELPRRGAVERAAGCPVGAPGARHRRSSPSRRRCSRAPGALARLRLAMPTEDPQETRAEYRGVREPRRATRRRARRPGCRRFASVPIECPRSTRPRATARRGVLGVRRPARERGARAPAPLTEASFRWAREGGYAAIVTDWRGRTSLSSRTWPRPASGRRSTGSSRSITVTAS